MDTVEGIIPVELRVEIWVELGIIVVAVMVANLPVTDLATRAAVEGHMVNLLMGIPISHHLDPVDTTMVVAMLEKARQGDANNRVGDSKRLVPF